MAADFDPTQMQQNIKAAAEKIHEMVADALTKAAHQLLEDTRRLVPTDTGTLAASGRVKVDREALTAAVGFGSGEAAEYAQIVHEDTRDAHDDGQSKYLEVPVVRARSRLAADIAAGIKL